MLLASNCVEARDPDKHPIINNATPQQRIIWPKMSAVPRLRTPGLFCLSARAHTHTHTHTHTMEYYSAIKKNEIMLFAATWMDLEIIILSEVSQTEKEKCHMISLICGI